MKKHILLALFAAISFSVSAQTVANNYGITARNTLAALQLVAPDCAATTKGLGTSKEGYVHSTRKFYWYNCSINQWVEKQYQPEIAIISGSTPPAITAAALGTSLAVNMGGSGDIWKWKGPDLTTGSWQNVSTIAEIHRFGPASADISPSYLPVGDQPHFAIDTFHGVSWAYSFDDGVWRSSLEEAEISLANSAPVGNPTLLQKMYFDTLASPTRTWINEGGVWKEQKTTEAFNWTQAGLVANTRVQYNGTSFIPVTDTSKYSFFYVNRVISGTTFEILPLGANGVTTLAYSSTGYNAVSGSGSVATALNCLNVGNVFNGRFYFNERARCALGGGSSGAAPTASAVTNVPAGTIAATTVQAALNELDAEKQADLLFQEEGVAVGGVAGTVTAINFVGPGVTATSAIVGTLNVSVPGSLPQLVPAILVFGESNAGGFVQNTSATVAEIAPQPQLKMWANQRGRFENLNFGAAGIGNNIQGHTGLAQGSTHGIELQLAQRAGQFPGDTVYMVKAGQGASMVGQWKGAYMDTLVARVAAATAEMRAKGQTPVWSVFLSLGINDAIAGKDIELVRDSMLKIISHVREKAVGNAHFYVTQLTPTYAAQNEELANFWRWGAGVSVIQTAGLSVLPDNNHWDYLGMKGLANRFIDSIFARGDGALGTLQQDGIDALLSNKSDGLGPFKFLDFEKNRQNIANTEPGRVVSTLNSTANYTNNIGGVDSITIDGNRDWRLVQLLESHAPNLNSSPLQIDTDGLPDYAWANSGATHNFVNAYYTYSGSIYVTNVSNAATLVGVQPAFPFFMKREKSGNDIIMSTSTDGLTWTQQHVAVNALAGATTLHFRISMPTVIGTGDNTIHGKCKAWIQYAEPQTRFANGVSGRFFSLGGSEDVAVSVTNPAPKTIEVDGFIRATSLSGSGNAPAIVTPNGTITRKMGFCSSWTTATRPTTVAGEFLFGYNTTTGFFEGYNGFAWVNL